MSRLLLALAVLPALAAAAEPIDLFDGKTLDGWVNVNCAPSTWSVVDGMIHCTGKPTGALRTEAQYENFILELEWRHLRSGGNAGVFVWAGPISAPGVPFLRAIEVQVLDHGYGKSESFTTHGDVFPIHGSTMEPFPPSRGQRSFPSEERSKGSPEWNHYKITCQDGTLRLEVNGKEVSGGENCTWRKGYIALESEGSPVDFRKITLTELPGTGAPPDATAPLAEGHRPLYSGIDLTGWTGEVENWQPSDWRLVYRGEGPGTLTTTETFQNAQLIYDYKAPGGKWERRTETVGDDPVTLTADAAGSEFASVYIRPRDTP